MTINNYFKNKKAFTIIELIAVITLLAIIGTVLGVNMIKMLNKNKEFENNEVIENIKSAADAYISTYPDKAPNATTPTIYISINDLQNTGFLPLDLKDPTTGEIVTGRVKVEKNNVGVLVFTYPG